MEEVRSNNPDISDFDLTETVFGPQIHGNVFGMGSGVRPTHYRDDRRSSSNSQRSTGRLLEENEELQEQMRVLEQKDAERAEEMRRVREEQANFQEEQARMQQREAQRDAQFEEQQRQLTFLMSMYPSFHPLVRWHTMIHLGFVKLGMKISTIAFWWFHSYFSINILV